MTRTFVVVGAGLCGGAAAQTLRDEGFDGRIVLIGDEPHLPYERPPLSKEYLRGEEGREALLARPASWYEEQEVETRLGCRAVALGARDRSAELDSGERLRADAILLATGGRARRLPGAPRERVLYLRVVEDADRIRAHLQPGRRLVVVGGGFIGAEVAASARVLGVEVTMLERGPVPLRRALGEEMGALYAEIHREHGVDLRTGEGVEVIDEEEGSVVVRTTRGAAIEGDAVVVGVGIEPNVELAAAAGVATDNGVVVDERCRTNVENVYAAGDVANHYHPVFGRHLRVEHYDNALRHGAAAARSMLDKPKAYDEPHWFWSDQYDVNLQYAGLADTWDEIVVRGSLPERSFVAFYLKGGVVVAALGLGRGREVRRALKVIQRRASPDPQLLRDESVDLRTLVPEG